MGNLMLLTEMSAYSNAVQQYGKDAADFWSQDSHGDRHLGMGACFHGNFFAIFLMVS